MDCKSTLRIRNLLWFDPPPDDAGCDVVVLLCILLERITLSKKGRVPIAGQSKRLIDQFTLASTVSNKNAQSPRFT